MAVPEIYHEYEAPGAPFPPLTPTLASCPKKGQSLVCPQPPASQPRRHQSPPRPPLSPGTAFSYVGTEGVNRGNELKVTKEIPAYDSDSRVCVEFLESHPDCTGKIGVMGFCIGGHLAFRAAMNMGVRAAACFYATDIHKGSLGRGMNDNSLLRRASDAIAMQALSARPPPGCARSCGVAWRVAERRLLRSALSAPLSRPGFASLRSRGLR